MFCHKQLVVLIPESSHVWKDKANGCGHYALLDLVLQQQQIHPKTRWQEAVAGMAAVAKASFAEAVLRQALPPEDTAELQARWSSAGENQWCYWSALGTHPANLLYHLIWQSMDKFFCRDKNKTLAEIEGSQVCDSGLKFSSVCKRVLRCVLASFRKT